MKTLAIKIFIFFHLGMTFSLPLAHLAHWKKYETLETVATILFFIFLTPWVLLFIFIILDSLYEKNKGNRMKIRQNETELKGKCILKKGKVIGDATYKRIEWLLGGHLKEVAPSQQKGRMETLYLDFNDRRYWERIYLHDEFQEGASLILTVISEKDVILKYGDEMKIFIKHWKIR